MRLVFDRVVMRTRGRNIGPIDAAFGPGTHGIAATSLEDLDLLDRGLRGDTSLEGRVALEDGRSRVVHMADLLPIPGGHTVRTFARLMLGDAGEAAVLAAAVPAGTLTDRLSPQEAFGLALALAEGLPEAGAFVLPSPHRFLSPHDDRDGARRVRALASRGFPVVVLLAPGIEASRWVDDVVSIDPDGRASAARGIAGLARPLRGVIVRGERLERVAEHMLRRGFELALDARGRELTVRAPVAQDLERALTDALASHDGTIDEVLPCAP